LSSRELGGRKEGGKKKGKREKEGDRKRARAEKNELLLPSFLLQIDQRQQRGRLTSSSVGVEDGGLYWSDGDGSSVEVDGGCKVLFGEEGVSSRFEEVGESGSIFTGHGVDFRL